MREGVWSAIFTAAGFLVGFVVGLRVKNSLPLPPPSVTIPGRMLGPPHARSAEEDHRRRPEDDYTQSMYPPVVPDDQTE